MIQVSDKLLRSAYASKLAYAESQQKMMHFKSTRQLHGPTLDTRRNALVSIERTGSQAYVWKSGDQSYLIAFRGSHDFRDVATYLNFRQQTFSFCDKKVNVHGGVLSMFESIEPELTHLLTDNNTKKLPKYLTFCGHSLGGGIASFASAYYGAQSHCTTDVTCHTFGAPFVGDTHFIEWTHQTVKENVIVKTRTDPIPNVRVSCNYKADVAHTYCINDNILDPFTAHDLDTYIELLELRARAMVKPPSSNVS